MAGNSLTDIFDIGCDVLATEIADNGSLTAQTGDVISNEVTSDQAEIWGCLGLASRPAKPVAGKSSAQCIKINGGDRDACIAWRDTRGQDIYGNLGPGDTVLYAPGPEGEGQAKVCLKGDGAITIHTTNDNTESGKGVYLRLDPNKLEFRAPWGRITFDASGFTVLCANGAKFNLGGVTPAFGAACGLTSYCNISAQTINCNGICNLGPSMAEGGLAKMPAMVSLIPPVAPFVPGLGVGMGAVTLFQTASTHVFISA